MSLCKSRPEKRRTPTAYRHLYESGFVCSSSGWEQRGIHHATVAYSLGDVVLYHYWSQKLQNSTVMFWWFDAKPYYILGAVAGLVYSQVSRLSLSMWDPERTVSMSIRRSELRPSGMQGINSSPSDIGSTGIDSCKVIEGVSLQSPREGTGEKSLNCQNSAERYSGNVKNQNH